MPADRPGTSFVGRRRELATLRHLLSSTRLLTVWGPGGSGKTRLALELRSRTKSGITAWVDLAPLREASEVAPAIERALGIPGDGTLAARGIARAASGTRVLVVLDNCDHLAPAAAEAAGRLIAGTAAVRVLATSRVQLKTPGEVVWRIPPLSLPDEAIDMVADPLRADAVRLFVERARGAAGGNFACDEVTLPDVLEICRTLDGQPLAIELAAARLRHLSVSDLRRRLDRSLQFLVGERATDARHRTLRATIDWSHDLLDEAQRGTFRRLAVFAADFTLDAAESVCGRFDDGGDVVASVTDLVDRSLVEFGDGRYHLLQPIREYAEERLREKGEEEAAMTACASYLVRLATIELAAESRADADRRIRAEFSNAAAVLPSLIRTEPRRALELLIRFAASRWTAVPVHLSVVSSWLSRALEAHAERDGLRARALLCRASLDREVADDPARTSDARAAVDEALAIALEIGDRELEVQARQSSASVAVSEGPTERAIRLYDDVEPYLRPRELAMALSVRSVLKQMLGDAAGAGADLDGALAAWDRHADPRTSERFLTNLCAADIAFRSGANSRAETWLRDAIRIRADNGDPPSPAPFELLARLAAEDGDHERALRLAGFADRLRSETGLWPSSFLALAERAWVPTSERAAGQRAAAVRREGRRMAVEDAIGYALGNPLARELTERELSVARLVAQGLSDREIGARLAISARTAENHVQHIRDKLGMRSRAQIGTWAATYGHAPA